jgi:hypothetical protein
VTQLESSPGRPSDRRQVTLDECVEAWRRAVFVSTSMIRAGIEVPVERVRSAQSFTAG